MWRGLLRVFGVGFGGHALVLAFYASMFRMDSAGELPWILRVDVAIGAALAVAVFLCRVPAAGEGSAEWHIRTAVGAVLVWIVVSGGLAWSHWEQHRIRSSYPVAGPK